jgi:nucleoside-diphosphate-sugar epimerase
MSILVTGANGFVGKALCIELHRQGQTVRAVTRSANFQVENIEAVSVSSIDGETDWAQTLRGVNMVIHLAALVHVMKDTAIDTLAEFRRVNVEGTLNLARQAIASLKRCT